MFVATAQTIESPDEPLGRIETVRPSPSRGFVVNAVAFPLSSSGSGYTINPHGHVCLSVCCDRRQLTTLLSLNYLPNIVDSKEATSSGIVRNGIVMQSPFTTQTPT